MATRRRATTDKGKTVRAHVFVTSFDDVQNQFLQDEVRLRVFPVRGKPVDADLSYDQAEEVIFKLQRSMGLSSTAELCAALLDAQSTIEQLRAHVAYSMKHKPETVDHMKRELGLVVVDVDDDMILEIDFDDAEVV